MIDGTEYAITLSFVVTNGGRSFDQIAVIDRKDCPQDILGNFLVHLGQEMLAGKVEPVEAS